MISAVKVVELPGWMERRSNPLKTILGSLGPPRDRYCVDNVSIIGIHIYMLDQLTNCGTSSPATLPVFEMVAVTTYMTS